MLKSIARLTALLGLVALVPFITVYAQSAAPAASQSGAAAIGGYCPVAYVAMKQAMKGDAAHASVYQGKTYHLTNADAKKMFDAAPAKYVPAYDGWCATAMAQGMRLASDPTLFSVHEGRAYLFSTREAKAMFDKDAKGIVAKADGAWAKLSR